MNPIAVVVMFIFMLFSNVVPAYDDEKINCSGISFSEVRSLMDLPEEVGALLGRGRPGRGGIADRNEKFDLTDAPMAGDEQLPFRRFNIAAASSNCILVAVERGGRGYFVEIWVFMRSSDRWHGEQRKKIYKVPQTLQELISYASK